MSRIEADARLRSFVERIGDPEARAEYVLTRTMGCLGRSARETHRAIWLANRFFRTPYELGDHAIKVAMLRGSAGLIPILRDDYKHLCGWVYRAVTPDYPHIVKIGFSRDLKRREGELCRFHGQRVQIVSANPGSMLDEHSEHVQHRESKLSGEWFRTQETPAPNSSPADGGLPQPSVPAEPPQTAASTSGSGPVEHSSASEGAQPADIDLTIPRFLRRDANNRAPFMEGAD